MDMKRMKTSAEWFRSTVFKEEAIRPGGARSAEPVPPMIRTARSLENGRYQSWQSREAVFMKQGKLLAGYEDDYDFQGDVRCYYPTYQALTNRELRGYFSWRTKLRKGDIRKAPLPFAFLYIYELINQIGVAEPAEGYRLLESFRDAYGQLDERVLPYLQRWMEDYIAYYGLDAGLLAGSPQMLREQSISLLEQIEGQGDAQILSAVKLLSSGWLQRSKYYSAYPDDMDKVIVRVLRRISAHYAARCKKGMVEQYFGSMAQMQLRPFDTAVFCDPLKRKDYEYVLDRQWVYRCQNGFWSVSRRAAPPGSAGKLDALLKTIDSVMRRQTGYRYPVQARMNLKWVLRIIEEEVQSFLAGKKAAEEKKVVIRYGQLSRIRQDAAFIQERLLTEEEADMPEEPPLPQPPPGPEEPVSPKEPAGEEGALLSPAEYRLLQSLLYGRDDSWVQKEGYMLSVLADGINEKLYDIFQDAVLDELSRPVKDYMEDLKEMVHP
ncbi:MAG: hypothetical protein HFG27_05400 [Provencibacterium sp.]|jgi:hypothetical protein|nr:hypothetical protein [Provencibacterium sp.]